jgi:prepilin-type N-terminal cleavage/methylation domain-containing protein
MSTKVNVNKMHKRSEGFTLFELVIVLLLSSIMMGIVGFQFLEIKDDLNYSANDMVGFLKRVRSKALASTYFYTVKPISLHKVGVSYSPSCGTPEADKVIDPAISITLGTTIALTNLSWKICFTPRGITSDSNTIILQDNDSGKQKTVEVVVGGAMRVI